MQAIHQNKHSLMNIHSVLCVKNSRSSHTGSFGSQYVFLTSNKGSMFHISWGLLQVVLCIFFRPLQQN